MTMELNSGDRRLALTTGVTPDGLPILAPLQGKCTSLVAGDRRVGLITGTTADGLPVIAWGQQLCKAGTSGFEAGVRYLGLITGVTPDGIPIISSWCETCGGDVTSCGCTICCTLEATVQVGASGDVYAWTDPLDVTLTCGRSILMSGGHCCVNDLIEDDFICFKITSTIAEKNTIGSPTAYIGASGSGTREAKSGIWSSGSFTLDGNTYRLSFWRIEGTVYQTSPSTVTTPFCSGGWVLQKLVTSGGQFDVYGPYWANVAGADLSNYLSGGTVEGQTPYAWAFNITDDNPYSPDDCPEGYSYSGGELIPEDGCDQHGGGGDPYTSGSSYTGSAEDCPVVLEAESWYRLNADPDDDAHRLKCAKISIADLC